MNASNIGGKTVGIPLSTSLVAFTYNPSVLEEAGVHVKNLRFYKSQPWVFTDTLLMGFFCELDGSDRITMQESELSEAGWFHRSTLPEDYSHISLTGEMIDQFRLGNF